MSPTTATIPAALLLAFAPALTAQDDVFVLEARTVSREAFERDHYDPSKALPWPERGHADCLASRMRALIDRRWEGDDVPKFARSFGDMLAALHRLRDKPKAQRVVLGRIERELGDDWAEVGDALTRLGIDHGVFADDWKPGGYEVGDGMLMGSSLQLGQAPMPAWREVGGSQAVHQAATVVFADLRALEAAEHDYVRCYDYVDNSYEFIYPVEGSLVRNAADADAPFVGLDLKMRSDLPFPFSHYDCTLSIGKTLDADGHLDSGNYADSEDFYWIASRYVDLPVRDADGAFVAMVVVRLFGMDLDGVPDGDSDRRSGMRSLLGNIKRVAEELHAARDPDDEPVVEGAIPSVPVRGRRARD